MKQLSLLLLAVVLLTACKKDKKADAPPPVTIYDTWILHRTAHPFSADTNWRSVKLPDEMTTFLLLANGQYSMVKYPDQPSLGTYTIVDSANTNIKTLILSNKGEPIRLYIQLLPTGELQMDDESIKNASAGYVRRKFARIMECSMVL